MLSKLLENHVLANLSFALVLVVGLISYQQVPREQDPTVNFNWVDITVLWPGAAPEDVEKLITDPLEDAIAKVRDINFVLSSSRESYSNLVVRFRELDAQTFEKRLATLRREVQTKANDELPDDAEDPVFFEVTSSNAFPTATLVVKGQADDEVLRRHALTVKEDLERFKGVERVFAIGLHEPELHVEFFPETLSALGVLPSDLADTVRAYFRDTPTVDVGDQQWLIRLVGKDPTPGFLAARPLITTDGVVPISSVAEVSRSRREPTDKADFENQPAVVLAVSKTAQINTLDLLDRINAYIESKNRVTAQSGVELVLIDDQTPRTREALGIMEANAGFGLAFVMLMTWLFLGTRIALFVGMGIPFTLAGLFWLLSSFDFTLNVSVLLGVIIALGMLVDDAVVVVESIYYRLQRGAEALQGAIAGVREVLTPVTASVLTTMAAFLPLMLMPGIMGQFMRVVPIVVTAALAISLVEAFWILPVHVAGARWNLAKPSPMQRLRARATHWLRIKYSRMLIFVMRRPKSSLLVITLMFISAGAAVGGGSVRVELFAADPVPLFYINVESPGGMRLNETLKYVRAIQVKVRRHLRPGELRAMAGYAGRMFTDTAILRGDHYGQVIVSLHPIHEGMRTLDEIIGSLREDVLATPGPSNIAFRRLSGGPPVQKPINIKVRGTDYGELRAAANALRGVLESTPAVVDISDDDSSGKPEMVMRLDSDAVKRLQLEPASLARSVRLLGDGEEVAEMQDQGEEVKVRVRARPIDLTDVDALLRRTLALGDGEQVALGQLVRVETGTGRDSIRHYNFRRTITLEADLDKSVMDTVEANGKIEQAWETMRVGFPGIDIDLGGELEDIQESLDSMKKLFWIGMGLVYLILGTQFRSYWQPFLILSAVPMAFTGAVLGLIVTRNPLSLFTIYGMIALAGIAVNAAIVMIVAANRRRGRGMSVLHATVYAARRRLIPILITTLTTIAGLFSLAVGLGGKSVLWGPVAAVIVWGLGFSTLLGLFFVPLLYWLFIHRQSKVQPGLA
jgi:multidrug efflux pump subunit AcrB